MNSHRQTVEALPLYASAGLTLAEREPVVAHLEMCSECRADLALWTALRREIQNTNRAVVAPAGLAERTLDAALGERPSAGLIRRAWTLVPAQAPLVSGSNLMMAFAASAALYAVMPAGLFGSVILGWLGPLTFLSTLALLPSMWAGTETALLVANTAWMLPWVSFETIAGSSAERWGRLTAGYRDFWNNTAALVALGALLSIAGLWSAERAARPAYRAEAFR
jgi:anti-sigma factor RsiW